MATANLSCDELSFSSRLNAYLILLVKSIDSDFLGELESFDRINPHIDVFSASAVAGLLACSYLPAAFNCRRSLIRTSVSLNLLIIRSGV